MPQVETTLSMIVKESQKDVTPTGEISLSFKDSAVEDYTGPMRVSVPVGETKKIDVSHLGSNKLVAVRRIEGPAFYLSLRKGSTESSVLKVGRCFFGELLNADQLSLSNPDGPGVVVVQIQMVAVKG